MKKHAIQNIPPYQPLSKTRDDEQNSTRCVIGYHARDQAGRAALGMAIEGRNIESIKMLLQLGANPNGASLTSHLFGQQTLLMFAVQNIDEIQEMPEFHNRDSDGYIDDCSPTLGYKGTNDTY